SPLLLTVFALSAFAGFAVRRLPAISLAFVAVAALAVWTGRIDEDNPLPTVVGGVLIGVALGRAATAIATVPSDAPATRWPHLKRVLRGVITKQTFEAVDELLDRLRFRIDTLPNGLYQPIPGLSARAARGSGSESRWLAILPVVEAHGVANAVDVGACEGYFSLKLAEAGIPTIAVESQPSNYRTALYAVKRSGRRDVGVLALQITPENATTLPSADCVLCLSVWHHFVRAHGLADATAMLAEIWQHTRKVMIFDTGEVEMTSDYNLPPMTPDARTWLGEYLSSTCTGSRVQHLGVHRAFSPGGAPCDRNLFAVIRTEGPGLDDGTVTRR
ncbi:MAG TPA: class I SAM-dependent methyltransferase, partial [Gaiellaceae bacterium]|nr:class I SAM-dependent methyltransferase [Gaiellaceae bacterium]